MSDHQASIVAEVRLVDGKGALHSLGPHRFIALPRQGEEVVAEFDGHDAILRVKAVIHIGDPLEEVSSVLKRLPIAALTIVCEKQKS